ncbi:hypothetical protein Q4595_29890, partial [Wenyingzhuangia sp. 1_MG-2023]|nr:hypothetical protein [Wenyingzhuangia sp. 1_MG-2023]
RAAADRFCKNPRLRATKETRKTATARRPAMPAPLTSATDPTTPAGATERGLVSASAALAHRILVIEDEPDIANLLALHLR